MASYMPFRIAYPPPSSMKFCQMDFAHCILPSVLQYSVLGLTQGGNALVPSTMLFPDSGSEIAWQNFMEGGGDSAGVKIDFTQIW